MIRSEMFANRIGAFQSERAGQNGGVRIEGIVGTFNPAETDLCEIIRKIVDVDQEPDQHPHEGQVFGPQLREEGMDGSDYGRHEKWPDLTRVRLVKILEKSLSNLDLEVYGLIASHFERDFSKIFTGRSGKCHGQSPSRSPATPTGIT
jgi:hypothetical protein